MTSSAGAIAERISREQAKDAGIVTGEQLARAYARLSPQALAKFGSEVIVSFLTTKLEEKPPTCQKCGSAPRLIGKVLDPKKGETVRMFICECHELTIWPVICTRSGLKSAS